MIRGVFNFFNNKKTDTTEHGKKTVVIGLPNNSFLKGIFSGGITSTEAMNYYSTTSSIATAVDLIADSFEQIPPRLFDIENDVFVSGSQLIKDLNNPNGFQSWMEFAGEISRHYLITGNTYLSALGNVKFPPVEIYTAKPQNVSTYEDQRDSFPAKYIVASGTGTGNYNREVKKKITRFYDGNLKELFHIMNFSSSSTNIKGDSPIKAAANEAKQLIRQKTHNLKILDNGGNLSLMVTFKDEDRITDDEHQERKRRINEQWAGPENAAAIGVISGPEVSVKEFGITNKDMDFAELEKLASQSIYLRYKIPLPLITTDATSFNNITTAVLMLYDWAVIPLANKLFSALSIFLLDRYRLDPEKYKITFNENDVTALAHRKIEEILKRSKIGSETVNELRSLIPSREPLKGGDTIYQPASMISIDDVFESEADEGKELIRRLTEANENN